MTTSARLLFFLFLCFGSTFVFAQEVDDHGTAADHSTGEMTCGGHGDDYDPAGVILHHIADANEFHIAGEFSIPLPILLYAPGHGLTTGLSTMFHHGEQAVDGYVMNHAG